MAELKKLNELPYDYIPVESPEEVTIEDQQPAIDYPVSPAKRLKHVSLLEKGMVAFLVVAAVILSVVTIQVRTSISKTEKEITSIQAELLTKEADTTRLQQEKSELSRTDRLKEIAEKAGLSVNDDNLRKVK